MATINCICLVCDQCYGLFVRLLSQYLMNQTWQQKHQYCSRDCFKKSRSK